jgi:two-component system nitrogen regulation response regulator GlnG
MSTPAPVSILVVDDDAAVSWALQQALTGAGYTVVVAADANVAQRQMKRQPFDLVITDIRMPGMDGLELLALLRASHPDLPVIVSTAHGTMETAITAVGSGAFDYLPKPLDLDRTLDVVRRALGEDRLAAAAGPNGPDHDQTLIGSSAVMQEAYRRIAAAVATDLGVLISGPSGTGKELVARSLHRHGKRRDGAFIAVNCGALPEQLIESELFGHEAGAFTDARSRKIGRAEAAHQGTLFLDEIAELPLASQAKLLRFLEDQRLIRVGGEQEIAVDVRVIAATNRDLAALVASGAFREDLAYRLRVVTIQLPPLSARLEDLPALVRFFLSRIARRLGRQIAITDAAMEQLHRHSWPGNVRELKHTIEEAAVLATGGVISPEHLQLAPSSDDAPHPSAFRAAIAGLAKQMLLAHPGDAYQQATDKVEDILFRAALAHTEGNQLRAAELLGINRITLKKRMDQLGITKS